MKIKIKHIIGTHNIIYTLRNIDWAQVIKLALWSVFCAILIFFLISVMNEKNSVNAMLHDSGVTIGGTEYFSINQIRTAIKSGVINTQNDPTGISYTTMLSWAKYPLIDFSLMLFVTGSSLPSNSPMDAWTLRWNNVSISYSYMFVTTLIALIGFVMLVVINFSMWFEHHREKKYDLSVKFPNSQVNYNLFAIKMYADLILNLAMVFAFFNFIDTLIVLGYWMILYSMTFIVTHIINKKLQIKLPAALRDTSNVFKPDKSMLIYLIGIMIFQNCYTLIKGFFINEYGVNLDLIISIIFPIGTITLIIGLFIKKMMDSKVNSVRKAIKTIPSTISTFRVFFNSQGINSLDDYSFVAILPPLIKGELRKGKDNKQKTFDLLTKLNESAKYIEDKYSKKEKQKNYLLYVLFTTTSAEAEVDEIMSNIHKISEYKKVKAK